jgi:hypothetical protein
MSKPSLPLPPPYKLTDLWRNIFQTLIAMQFDSWTCLEDRRAIRALAKDMNNKELVVQIHLRIDMLQRAHALLNKKIDASEEEEEEVYTNGNYEDCGGFDLEMRRLNAMSAGAAAWAEFYS